MENVYAKILGNQIPRAQEVVVNYTIKKIPISKIHADNLDLSDHHRREHQKMIQLTKRLNLKRPVLVQDTETGFRLIAGTSQFVARKDLEHLETTCIVFKDEPPEELGQLVDEFGLRDSNPMVEAGCIQRLIANYDMSQSEISRLLGISKQIICDTYALINLPQAIVEDACKNMDVSKAALIKLSRAKINDAEKIQAYIDQKQLANQKVRRCLKGEIKDITLCIRRATKILLVFDQKAAQGQANASAADLYDLATEFDSFKKKFSRFRRKYDASYWPRKAIRFVFRR